MDLVSSKRLANWRTGIGVNLMVAVSVEQRRERPRSEYQMNSRDGWLCVRMVLNNETILSVRRYYCDWL